MRKLAWAALPFAAAVFLAYYFLPIQGLPYFAAALFGISFAGFAFRGNTRRKIRIACIAAAVGLGWYALYWAATVTPCEAYDGEVLTVSARVTDYPETADGYSLLTVRMTDDRLPSVKAQVLYYGNDFDALEPGDEILLTAELSVEEKSFLADGYTLFGFAEDSVTVTGRWDHAWLFVPQRVCHAVQKACDACFSADAAPLIKAMMTGDKQDLKGQADVYAAMQISGVAHIIAVSGMHVMFLMALVQLVFGKGRLSALIGLPLLLFFVLMTGAQPSVIRAAVLQALFFLAPLFERDSDNVTSLSFALALLLVGNPCAVGSVSLQLSFAAAGGLVLLLPAMGRWKQAHIRTRLGGYVADSVQCTIGATAFSMPIAAYYFGTVPLLSALINLLTLSVLELVFCAGYLLSALYFLLPRLAALLGVIPSAAVRLCETVFLGTARLPFACAYTENPAVLAWLIFLYGSILVTFIARRRGKAWRYYVPAALSVIVLCLVLTGSKLAAGFQTKLTVLDVGQGECVALFDGNATVLVDCGGKHTEENAGSTAASCVGGNGRSAVDLLVLTHLHEDHTNGVVQLMYRMPVRRLAYYVGCDDGDTMLEEIRQAAAETGTELWPITEECAVSVGDMELSLCLPLAGEDENERGIVVAAELRDTEVLILGDLGEEGELALVGAGRARADILVAGHHGSKYSSSALFLQTIRPAWGIVSVGQNSYGHPTEVTMQRLSDCCGTVRRTDQDGDITIRIR